MLTSLPTWIIACVTIKFVKKDHPWYNKKFTLKDWYEHETDYTRFFDVLLWGNFFAILCLLAVISTHHISIF